MKAGNPLRLLLACWLMSLLSCSGPLDLDAYQQWVHDPVNGLHVTQTVGEYQWEVQYLPAPLVAWQRSQGDTLSLTEEASKEMARTQYYTLTITPSARGIDLLDYGISSPQEKSERLYYFSYVLQNNIFLEEQGQRLPCVLYHFERSTGSRNSRTFVLGFENRYPASPEAKLLIEESRLSALPVRIKVSKQNIPALAL